MISLTFLDRHPPVQAKRLTSLDLHVACPAAWLLSSPHRENSYGCATVPISGHSGLIDEISVSGKSRSLGMKSSCSRRGCS